MDRRTDGRTTCRSNTAVCVASRGKTGFYRSTNKARVRQYRAEVRNANH